MTSPQQARLRRERASTTHRPESVRLLLVAEAPPAALDRYFYFADVRDQDSLFRHVVKTVLGQEPSRTAKSQQMIDLRRSGVFLIDLKSDPKADGEALDAYVPDLVKRALALKPDHVITIKANVCDLCQEPMRSAGLNVVDVRIPFPGSGQQGRFVETMGRALATIDWSPSPG